MACTSLRAPSCTIIDPLRQHPPDACRGRAYAGLWAQMRSASCVEQCLGLAAKRTRQRGRKELPEGTSSSSRSVKPRLARPQVRRGALPRKRAREIGDPLLTFLRDAQISECIADIGTDGFPKESRVSCP